MSRDVRPTVLVEEARAPHDDSGVFWRGASAEEVERIRALNRRIGSGWQPLLSRLFIVYMAGPVVYSALRALFRLRVEGFEHVERAGEKAILACRHFYEWDPAVIFFGMYWPWGARDWRWAPHLLAGQFWTRTPLRRALSWWLSNLALVRGEGEQQVAFERVAELMAAPGPRVVGMFPTGPIGQAAHVPPRPGIAYLAMRCPEVPVLPVSLVGLQRIKLRDVLALRRPILTIAVGAPFKASDLSSSGGSVARIVGRIDQTWRELEAQNS